MGLLDKLFGKGTKTQDIPSVTASESSSETSRYADSSDSKEWVSRGNALVERGRLEDAITAFRRATTCDPKNAIAWAALAALLSKLGKLDDGIAAYRKALELSPTWVQLWGGLGAALAQHGEANEAIHAFKCLSEKQPQNAQALKSLAELLLKVGNTREALSVLNNAMSMVLGDKELRELLHRAHDQQLAEMLRGGPG